MEMTATPMRDTSGLTFGLEEFTLLNTDLDGLVELGIEGTLRREGDLVVGNHILLKGLATIAGQYLVDRT